MKIKIKKLKEKATIPTYSTPDSAGMDLYACIDEEITIKAGETKVIPTGVAVELPERDYAVFLYARSGLGVKHGICLANGVGVVDADYRGEICVGLLNTSKDDYVLKPLERVAQMVVAPVVRVEFQEVENLSDTIRGTEGFGSTGRI